MLKILRPYQQEAHDTIMASLSNGTAKQICCIPTGGGKTLLSAKVARNFKKILFMCHTEELLAQSGSALLTEFYPEMNLRAIEDNYGGLLEYFRYLSKDGIFIPEEEKTKFGVIKADLFGIDAHITIASYQTIHRRLDRIPKDWFDLIIIDECHRAGSATTVKTLSYFTPKLLLGLSATPYRYDGTMLGDIFDAITYQYNIGDAIRDGYLCELDGIQVRTQLNLDNVHTLGGEFNQKELSEQIDTPERNQLLVDSYKKYADGLQNLVFCVNVEHAQNVCQTFIDNGYNANFVVGDTDLTPDRKRVIEDFKNGETLILCNCEILTTGFDHPGVGVVTMARPTKSLTLYLQCLGRATRTLPGVIDGLSSPQERIIAIKNSKKPKAIILDIVDVTSKHRVVNSFELDKAKPIEERVFTTTAKKQLLIDHREKAKIEANKKIDQRVNLFEIPKVEFNTSPAMRDPATEKQLAVIKDNGYDIENILYTKAMANQIISGLPASDKQIGWLRWKKYDVDSRPGLTYGEFQLCKEEIDRREAALKPKEIDQDLPF